MPTEWHSLRDIFGGKKSFGSCNHCGNSSSGDEVMRCDTCGTVFCSGCKKGWIGAKCPRCDSSSNSRLGFIS